MLKDYTGIIGFLLQVQGRCGWYALAVGQAASLMALFSVILQELPEAVNQ